MNNYEMKRALNKLHRVQTKTLLDFMGIPIKDQEDSVKKARMILEKLAAADPDKFEQFYNIVVNHELPTIKSSVDDEERLRNQRILSEHVNYLEKNVIDNVVDKSSRIVSRLQDAITEKVDKQIEAAKKDFVTYQVKVGNKKPKKIDGTPPRQFTQLLELAQARLNILMVGPSGCGKTHVAEMLANALDLEFAAQSCSVGVSESNFVGWLLPTGNNGKFNHVVSSFLRLYENGGLFLIDEMDNADPNLLVFLNMALANKGFYLPQRFDNPEVKRHPDFVCVAAANTFGGGADNLYTSRNALDAATLDRFRIGTIEMDYDLDVESQLVKNQAILDWAYAIRSEINNHHLAKLMSTRAMLDADRMMSDFGWSIRQINKSYFSDWSPEEKAMVKMRVSEVIQNIELRDEAA